MPNIDLSILNQRQTPAFYASSLATRPAFGFAGRIFIDTDSPSTGLYRDTGAAWVQIADPGAGTTGNLQQVTTNGNTTSQGITITAGGLSSNIVNIAANGLGSTANYIGQTYATNDTWKIYGTGSTLDQGEMVFQVGDNGAPYASLGERFRFSYDATSSGTAKDVFIVDYDLSYFNTSLGINTPTPGAALDVHSAVSGIAHLNQTVATNNSLLNFQNSGSGLWRIGSFYNAGANDFGIFDVVGSAQPVTVKKTTGQVLIGTSTVGSGKLVVASSTSDNGVQIVGTSAPSLRIDNAESGPTKRAGLGISTATNNFIQGSADRDFCIFNGSTTASPILFGVYGTTNVVEAARISAAGNFLIGTTTDSGDKLRVAGSAVISLNLQANQGNFLNAGVPAIYATRNLDVTIVGSAGQGIEFGAFSGATRISGAAIYGGLDNPATTGNLVFQTLNGGTLGTRATITSSGNLLIATSTDAGQKLQVNGTSYFIGNISIGTTLSATASAYKSIQIGKVGNWWAGSSGASEDWYLSNNSFFDGSSLKSIITAAGSEYAQVSGAHSWSTAASVTAGSTQTMNVRMTIKNSGVINLANVPTSAAGLVSGDIYRTANVLNIVP